MHSNDLWTYGDTTIGDVDIVGFEVEARDGGIGKIDEATYDAGTSHIVVDTGPWIFGKKVVLPAGVIERFDTNDEKVFVTLSKDEIKNAPEFDETMGLTDDYRQSLGTYYGQGTRTGAGAGRDTF